MAFIALMALRVAVGYHFFKEGTSKLEQGDWTSQYFLAAAKGPAAPLFHAMLDDPDGRARLCIKSADEDATEYPDATGITADPNDPDRVDIDPTLTFELWRDFVDRAKSYYQFDRADLQEELAQRRQDNAQRIQAARATQDRTVDTAELEAQRKLDEENILKLRSQSERASEILASHIEQMEYWLETNRVEILSYYGTESRLKGFDRDGDNRRQVATYVSSLREQVDTIKSDRQKQLRGWTTEVESMWDSLESQINDLAVDAQAEKEPLRLHRMFDQEQSRLKMIDKFIPWFDTIVGALLIVGLFTRFASLAAGLFLLSVICSQPPWIPGTTPTYFQAIEMFGLLVIFATCAGRMGGLDFFFSSPSTNAPANQD